MRNSEKPTRGVWVLDRFNAGSHLVMDFDPT
jgi:hypothetical protein